MAGEKLGNGGELYGIQKDILSSKEKLFSLVPVITISGLPGTGKTKIVEELSEVLSMDSMKVGDWVRQWLKEERGEDVLGYAQRSPEDDKIVDRRTAVKIKNSILGNKKIIIEAQLGGWICKNVLNDGQFKKNGKPLAFTIYLKGNKEIRHKRVWKREHKKNPSLTLEKVTEETTKREIEDPKAWALAHPQLTNNSPHSENCVDDLGKPVYDLVVDTSDLSVKGVLACILGTMLERGLLQRNLPLPPRNLAA